MRPTDNNNIDVAVVNTSQTFPLRNIRGLRNVVVMNRHIYTKGPTRKTKRSRKSNRIIRLIRASTRRTRSVVRENDT